jgi:hypothetical protein
VKGQVQHPSAPVPAKNRLPRRFLDPDPLQEAPDDTHALLRLSLTEHPGDLAEHKRLRDRVDACRCRVARPSPRGLKRPLEPLGLTFQIHEHGSHTREVVVSAREGLDQPGIPGSRLSEARVQIVDGVAVSRTTTFAPRDPEALDDVTSQSYLQPVRSTSRHPHWRSAGHVFGLALVVFD